MKSPLQQMDPSSLFIENSFLDPNFALNLFRKLDTVGEIIPKIKLIIKEFERRDSTNQSTSKDDSKSIALRDEAETLLCNDKNDSTLVRVLELYNESICYAYPASNGHLASLYARRASIYFDLKEYEHCLENISLAESYTKDDPFGLNKLKGDCFTLLQYGHSNNHKESDDTDVPIRLNVKSNDRIPTAEHYNGRKLLDQITFAASCLELKIDAIRGRHITTNEDIDPGSIIVIESPFIKILNNDCLYQRCSNCLKRNSLNLIPCVNCTKAMFCSEKCMAEAVGSFHQYECPIINCLINVGGQITLRAFLKAIYCFDSIHELIEFIKSPETLSVTAFSFDHTKELWSPKQHYQQFHNLSTNRDIRSKLDLFTHMMVAALFYYQLSYHSPFKDVLTTVEFADSLMELMFRIELITTINSFNFNDLSSFREDTIIGTGIYPLSSFINHSCIPNACPKYYNNNLILYTTQPIRKGDSISISYK